MYWDTNPPAAADFHNIWIPTTATTLWQAGTPNGPGDRVHYPGLQRRPPGPSRLQRSTAAAGLHVPSSNPAIKDGATFQFLFTLDDGLGTRPALRLP